MARSLARAVARGSLIASLLGSLAWLPGCEEESKECPAIGTRPEPGDPYPALDPGIECRVTGLLEEMTLEEKIAQMHGSDIIPEDDLYVTPENDRLSIPGFRMVDGPRGVRAGKATTFPVAMARGATWNPDLERRVGEAIGLETRAKGGNVLLAPCINLLRHPGWGRAQETYGEDPVLLSEMGVAFIEGAQRHVIANAKHLAANSIEDTRFDVDVSLDPRPLREVYLPHFRAAVQRGRVGSVMSAYNQVNGSYCSENEHLLRDILKDEWGFEGFVVSDWIWAVRSTVPSAIAGLDIEMPAPMYYGDALRRAVEEGEVPLEVIDEAVRRVLRQKLRFGLAELAPVDPAVVESPEHVSLAREVARQATVLLKNEGGLLPLDPAALAEVAVVGRLADATNLGDHGSSNAQPSRAVTPLQGISDRLFPATIVRHLAPEDVLSPEDATRLAAADVAIVVVGLTAREEGEYIPGFGGGDRDDLSLSVPQQELIQQAVSVNPRTVVVLEGGSAITVEGWIEQVPALMVIWYPGQEGGAALADVLSGDVSPSGKLPFTLPVSAEQLPGFDHESLSVVYGYFHGYWHVDREDLTPRFPFGFGLSYTTFRLSNLSLAESHLGPDSVLQASVTVENTGNRAGAEVVQLHVEAHGSAVERPVRSLQAFARVDLDPGQAREVVLQVPVRRLAYFEPEEGRWVVEPLDYTAWLGTSSRDLSLSASFTVR